MRFRIPAKPGQASYLIDTTTGHTDEGDAIEFALPHILRHRRYLLWAREIRARTRAVAHLPADFFSFEALAADTTNESWKKYVQATGEKGVVITTPMLFQPDERKPREDGGFTQCSKDGSTLIHFNSSHQIVGAPEPNTKTGTHFDYVAETHEHRELRKLKAEFARKDPTDDLDERVFQAWMVARNVKYEREIDARNNALNTLHEVAPGRNFSTYTRADVKALVAAWIVRGVGTEGMEKLRGHLRGMVNVCLDNARREEFPEIKENVFTGDYIPPRLKGEREPTRLFTDDDHALIMADLPSWPISSQRLFMLGRTCGLRRGECFTIVSEERHENIRCMVVCDDPENPGKNGFANRLLPTPDSLVPYLPDKIEGSLFEREMHGTAKDMMKRIRKVLVAAGSPIKGKTHKSLRHGVETMLGQAQVQQRITDAILGHVPEDLKGNTGDNQAIRAAKAVKYRYFHGNKAQAVLNALNLIVIS